jgi:LPXTG-motif cell wall-anchored protein
MHYCSNMKRFRNTLLAVGLVAATATGTFGAVTAHAATISAAVGVSCVEPIESPPEYFYYSKVGDSVSITVDPSCAWAEVDGGSAGPTTPTMVFSEGDEVAFHQDSLSEPSVIAFFKPIYAQHTPSGQLLLTQDITLGLTPSELMVSDAADSSGEHALGGLETCELEADGDTNHVYTTLPIRVTTSGTYTFRGIGSTPAGGYFAGEPYHPIEDPFLAVYSTFDPTQPDVGVIGCNDDLNDLFTITGSKFLEDLGSGILMEAHQPYFSATLAPGNYTLVLLTWGMMSATDWEAGNSVDGPFVAGAASVKFEMWGPAAGLTTDVTTPAVPTPSLAATGMNSSVLPVGVMAVMVLGVGVLLVRRRRASH